MRLLICLLILLFPLTTRAQAVPFVGCPSDGQVGPLAAPHGHTPKLTLPPAAAAQLAWYQAEQAPGVLAPRGWHCFSTYGSNGATLYVAPEPLTGNRFLGGRDISFTGPAIEISSMSGSTSGRFEVAAKIARLFPAHIAFTQSVIAEGLVPATDFPRGPYPTDTLLYKTKTLAEFTTPAHAQGLGTESFLKPNDQPILGFVFLSIEPQNDSYDVSLELRLTPALASLGPIILATTEQTLK